ncbi:hypothetical protein D3C83_150360 [compost metagenome]
MPLDTFDVSLCDTPKLLACRDGREHPENWSLHDISPGPEFVAACAVRAPGLQVRTFQLQMS